MYRIAVDAKAYDRQRNVTILKFQKFLYNLAGKQYKDTISANNKIPSNFFNQLVTQQNQYLLGNGVFFDKNNIKNKFYKFDFSVQKVARRALVSGTAFGYLAGDRIIPFDLVDFVPLWDEETGALRAGIRFYRMSKNKPLYIELYEEDGVTQYSSKTDEIPIISKPKRAYIEKYQGTMSDGLQLVENYNYSKLPIVPIFGNPNKQSELVGIRAKIDAYDLTLSGLKNDIDENAFIYWIVKNAGGMDDIDLIKVRENLKTAGIANIDGDNADIEHFNKDVPVEARMRALEKLENDIYRDFGALNPSKLQAGSITATAINASYQALDDKCSQFEYEVADFINGILALKGLTAEPSFKRQKMENALENAQIEQIKTASLMAVAQELDDETLLTALTEVVPELANINVNKVLADKSESEYLISDAPNIADDGAING